MKLLWKKEEEREKVKKKEQLEEEILEHMRERMVKETIEVEDPHPMEDTEEDLGGADIHREPHGLGPPEPDPMLLLGGLMDTLRMAGLRANPSHI